MGLDDERQARAQQAPLVGGLPPNAPGISAAIRLTPGLGVHLRGLADELLVHDFPGATISRPEREMLATAVSAGNGCFFCMDSHAAHASALLEQVGATDVLPVLDQLTTGSEPAVGPKMRALLNISSTVRRNALELTSEDIDAACAAGASDADIQLAVLIAAAFSMYNRMVDGLRAPTSPVVDVYRQRASEIATYGYSAPPPTNKPD
jgi:uncharacterized peroxidase-related enzyme